MPLDSFPPGADDEHGYQRVVNAEQLEAEFAQGQQMAIGLDLDLTTLAHLIMACQYALKAPTICVSAARVVDNFARQASRKFSFGPETQKLIRQGWQDPTS